MRWQDITLKNKSGDKMGGRRIHRERTFRRGAESAFSTTNAEEIKRAVQKLREKGEHVINAAKLALAYGVDQIVADAKSRVPVRSGKLKESIKALEVAGVEEGVLYEITANATNKKGIAYGQFVEFDPKINKPFLYPAMDANRDNIARNIKESIQDAIRRGS